MGVCGVAATAFLFIPFLNFRNISHELLKKGLPLNYVHRYPLLNHHHALSHVSLQVDGFVLSIVIIVGSRILNAVLSKYQGLDFQGIVLVEPLTLLLWSNDYPLRDLIYIDHVTLRIAQSFRPVYSISCPSF